MSANGNGGGNGNKRRGGFPPSGFVIRGEEEPLKRYLLFAGNNHYPEGGWFDFEGDFDTTEEAVGRIEALISEDQFDNASTPWWHVLDRATETMVAADDASIEDFFLHGNPYWAGSDNDDD